MTTRSATIIDLMLLATLAFACLIALRDCSGDPVHEEPGWTWPSPAHEQRARSLALEVEREAELARARATLLNAAREHAAP